MDWAEQVSRVDDLDGVWLALIRETVIRGVMAASGESREITAEMVDAVEAMDQEAVLNLTEGEPTTLEDALSRLVEVWRRDGVPDGAEYELTPLLKYPWPGVLVPEDVTRLEIDVRWSPREDSSYYHLDERADLLEGWIESALCDRADSPEVVSFKAS